MALFKKDEILGGGKSPDETFDFKGCFELPEDEDVPTLTIKVNNEVREVEHYAKVDFEVIPIQLSGEDRKADYSRDPYPYLKKVLQKAYKTSEGLIDDPTKPAIIALMLQKAWIADFLCEKIMSFFEDDNLKKKQQEDDDEKN